MFYAYDFVVCTSAKTSFDNNLHFEDSEYSDLEDAIAQPRSTPSMSSCPLLVLSQAMMEDLEEVILFHP